jgi:hypothetical protein
MGERKMERFFTTTFGPTELEIIGHALEEWRVSKGVKRGDEDYEIAAAAMLTLFREGNTTLPQLRQAVAKHKWLSGEFWHA